MIEILSGPLGLVAGAVAAVSGFGIGSLLTPLFAWEAGTKIAVAAVAIPHFIGTGLRLWIFRQEIDRRILRTFGVASVAGGLAGALLYVWFRSDVLTALFGSVLILTGVVGAFGLDARFRFRGPAATAAGIASGLLGGLVGNQGGIRSAALLGFDVAPRAFVATSTAVAIVIDSARLPFYMVTQGREVAELWLPVIFACLGVLAGTLIGRNVIDRLPERTFKRAVSVLVGVLGIYILYSLFRTG